MSRIPNADKAVVDARKLRDYCLSMEHPRGRHKARVFLASLGLTREDAAYLQAYLHKTVATEPAMEVGNDHYGRRYLIDSTLDTGRRSARIRSLWIVRRGEDFPRFTSCYVL
ncbi:MAG: hypothetical protein HY941_04735 [Gammaproteobacteria bacterium]|nr:hypothetical protein [Gammaproteobacteria bacterium]